MMNNWRYLKLGKPNEDMEYSDEKIMKLESLIADKFMYSGFDED